MNMNFRYQDFVDQQRTGLIHGVFIDDTGSPGLQDSPGLHPKGKSWIAVFVPKDQLSEVWSEMPKALDELRHNVDAKEFHFTDIYAGRGVFKAVDLNMRLAIFRFMAEIFSVYRFPIFVQTLDPELIKTVRSQQSFPDSLVPFNLTKHEDLALFLLLIRIKLFLQERFTGSDTIARVFVDEGYKKNGAAIVIPAWETVFADGLVCFAKSDSIIPLQLADFAAFCLNRSQLIMGKPEPTELDVELLRIIQSLNFQNIPNIPLSAWFAKGESSRQ